MDKTENKDLHRAGYAETRIIGVMIVLTVMLIICMFFFSRTGNTKLPAMNSTATPGENNIAATTVSYKEQDQNLEKDYDLLIKKVQGNLKSAETVYQQQAISSYYSMEAMGLLIKQNSLIVEQNDKIIQLLTEIKNK